MARQRPDHPARIRTFIVWSGEQKLNTELSVGFRQARSGRLMTQDDRLDWLARCLTGEPDTLPYRVAAVLLLLYAQPLVRVAALRTERIHVAPAGILVLLGKQPAPVPEPFAGRCCPFSCSSKPTPWAP